MTYTPRLPSHLMFRAIAIRRLQERKAMLAAVMAEQNRINQRTRVNSTTFRGI